MEFDIYLFSVIIPIYNVADYIEDCLASIILQTYKEPFECILINDCSSDNSMTIVRNIISQYEGNVHFVVIEQEKNKGVSYARNTGIYAAKGKYVYFVDSDDRIMPNCLESIAEVIKKNTNCQMVSIGLEISSPTLPFSDYEKNPLPEVSNNPLWISTAMLSYRINVAPWTKCVKKQFIFENNLFFQPNYIFEDDIWHFELAQKIEYLCICNKRLYFYRVRENSIMSGTSKSDKFTKRINAINLKINLINGSNNTNQIKSIWNQLFDLLLSSQSKEDLFLVRKALKRLRLKAERNRSFILLTSLLPPQLLKTRILISFFSKILYIDSAKISPVL